MHEFVQTSYVISLRNTLWGPPHGKLELYSRSSYKNYCSGHHMRDHEVLHGTKNRDQHKKMY